MECSKIIRFHFSLNLAGYFITMTVCLCSLADSGSYHWHCLPKIVGFTDSKNLCPLCPFSKFIYFLFNYLKGIHISDIWW